MTTSKETEWMNHPRLRKLVTAVNELTLAERLTLVKGLVPAIADELSDTEYLKRGRDQIRETLSRGAGTSGRGQGGRRSRGTEYIEGAEERDHEPPLDPGNTVGRGGALCALRRQHAPQALARSPASAGRARSRLRYSCPRKKGPLLCSARRR